MKNTFLLICMFSVSQLFAQADIEEKVIHFTPGSSSAKIEGSIQGYQIIDYLLTAKKGQAMTVNMHTNHLANYYNVLFEDDPTALHNSSINGQAFAGILPQDGMYRIRVYLMRSAARRNEKATYTIDVSITGSRAALGDAMVEGTPYHATGPLPCSFGSEPMGSGECDFGVIRMGYGKAEVHITTHGGPERVLLFDGDNVKTENNELGLKASKSGDEWMITINDFEHFRIPDAVIYGG